jgi:hypothetical protein
MAETPSPAPANRPQARRKAASASRSTAAEKAAATRARNRASDASKRSTSAKKAAETRRDVRRTPVERYADYAGRAVTIQLGAALTARDRVVGLATKYSSLDKVEGELRSRLETDLRKFERRGTTARNGLEHELRRRRDRVERDLRGVRRDASAQAGVVGARVEHLVQSGLTAGTQAAAKAIERAARAA